MLMCKFQVIQILVVVLAEVDMEGNTLVFFASVLLYAFNFKNNLFIVLTIPAQENCL
jgi:hypothetical protein